ncbi:MAG: hypothetical protein U9R75_05290 [Candidatus Thermoplasmatota archaeon]|nr:hypothetical protein [Candidatus Thermoplasmatota archaeon]
MEEGHYTITKYFIELVRTLKPKGILIVVDIEKLDSILLETILSDNVEYDGEGPFTGEDIDELITVLEGKLRNIKISTVKELFVLHGHRSKSSR